MPDEIRVRNSLYLAPLVPLVGRGEGALVLVVSREQGRFYRLHGGRLEDLADHTEEQPRRHDQGGLAQARFQRHVDELAQEHLRRVAEVLDRLVRQLHGTRVVVVASEETGAEFLDLVAQDTRAAIAGVAHAEAHAHPRELLEVARPCSSAGAPSASRSSSNGGRRSTDATAAARPGWADTLEAASDGRVDLLLFKEGANHPAKRCPACGRLSLEGAKCPLDGNKLEDSDDGLDLAVHQTLAHGGTIWAVRGRDELDAVAGLGALLRF